MLLTSLLTDVFINWLHWNPTSPHWRKTCKFVWKVTVIIKGYTNLWEPLDVLGECPHAAPVVVIEELDDGRVHCIVWWDGAEEVGVLFLVCQYRGGCCKGQLGRKRRNGKQICKYKPFSILSNYQITGENWISFSLGLVFWSQLTAPALVFWGASVLLIESFS